MKLSNIVYTKQTNIFIKHQHTFCWSRMHSIYSLFLSKPHTLRLESHPFCTQNSVYYSPMSASITDYFKPKNTIPTATTQRNKKRKLDEDDGGKIEQIEATKTISSDDDVSITEELEPTKKRTKLTESKEESEDENAEQEEEKITYANCDKLLHKSWKGVLSNEFKKPYFIDLRKKLEKEQSKGVEIFPPLKMVFRAFDLCQWNDLKAVILGQDPYHDNKQAEGLCFSVPKGVKIPSSLRNMMKEATSDIQFENPGHGSLIQWGEQGVLLLNTVLTVQAHKANSHKKFGWQTFTDAVIKTISQKHDGVVFILWGKQAQKKIKLIDVKKHKVIESPHPSGLSAHRGFYGSKPYSKCNAYLKELGKDPIDWQIDPAK
eukprot:54422_1